MMKPKLLVTTSTFPRWENDTTPPFVYELSKRLTKYFDVTIHAPHYPGSKKVEDMEQMRVYRFRYFFNKFEKLAGATGILPTLKQKKLYYFLIPFFLISQLISLFILTRKIRPTVIHAHWILPQGFLSVLVGRVLRVPVAITAHGTDVFGLQNTLSLSLKKFTLHRSQAITVVSRAMSDALSKLNIPKLHTETVPMGVDSSMFSPTKKSGRLRRQYKVDGLFLLFVGRLTEVKGVKYLINAMPMILDEIPTAKLLIVGQGELKEDLETQVAKLKLKNNILFIGSLHNKYLPEYYASADIFIGPSIITDEGDTEGFGLTFVEAAMSGCLVIGTNVGGIEDIIHHDQTGFIIPEKDSDSLAKCIIYTCNNKLLTEHLTDSARKRSIKKYDWHNITQKYVHILTEMIM